MLLNLILGCLAGLSLMLVLWQWLIARRFPLHRRILNPSFAPEVTLLKPLKGCEETTESCLRSWFLQDYPGPVQAIFAVASAADPVCEVVRKLIAEFPGRDAQLLICGPLTGTNLKVSKLMQAEALAKHEILLISDADVKVPPDFLTNVVAPLADPSVGLVNCFYQLANPTTMAMEWEAVAINSDFWSQVLQSRSLRPLDFALGAVMVVQRKEIAAIGGFAALANCLADDYQLGHRIVKRNHPVVLSPIVVECWSEPMSWRQVWKHQLRWARTIRVCQPLPYFFSILSNGTLWPLIWMAVVPLKPVLALGLACWFLRMGSALDLQHRLTRRTPRWQFSWLVLGKDLLQTAIWALAFLGNKVEWRGERMRLLPDGTLVKA